MTAYNIYCDESRHTSDPRDRYTVIGALACPRECKRGLVHAIHQLKARHDAQGEFGWKRLSPNREAFYGALADLFLNDENLSFRCIVVDRHTLDHDTYNEGDAELGFYKLYYQMLVHWLQPGNEYHLYLDWQQNEVTHRFSELQAVLANKLSGRAKVACLEPVESDTQPLIQLADLLTGAVSYQWNGRHEAEGASQAKVRFAESLARGIGKTSLAQGTPRGADKFNIFDWRGRGR